MLTGSNVSGTNGTVATPSQMSLTFSADDRYTFAIDKDGGSTADATITADVTNGDLGAMSTSSTATLHPPASLRR